MPELKRNDAQDSREVKFALQMRGLLDTRKKSHEESANCRERKTKNNNYAWNSQKRGDSIPMAESTDVGGGGIKDEEERKKKGIGREVCSQVNTEEKSQVKNVVAHQKS